MRNIIFILAIVCSGVLYSQEIEYIKYDNYKYRPILDLGNKYKDVFIVTIGNKDYQFHEIIVFDFENEKITIQNIEEENVFDSELSSETYSELSRFVKRFKKTSMMILSQEMYQKFIKNSKVNHIRNFNVEYLKILTY